ncbi:MAG: UDP-N-acetylmuramoyl-tripeptide--D-alanyl-D-alanine ligase [Victivallaceae bacterium]|nr:UDP-N-acetylmuramoyl-tripeptide--D-alanyl-D-alanine ligase [Victivallaceae bacterium]
MSASFTAAELAAATAGKWDRRPSEDTRFELFTDTRLPVAGGLFVALRGERFDGHDMLEAAVNAGAGALCVESNLLDKLPRPCCVPVMAVRSTLDAYQNIARFHRMRFADLTVVAVTGSVGKTSVKEMLRAILAAEAGGENVLWTIGNTNNQIGVPQNLLRLEPHHRFAVIECGTNHPGEIAPLSRMAHPAAALVNSIAPCHLEFLGDLAGVAREKAFIYSGLGRGGAAVWPKTAPESEILEAAARLHDRLYSFGPAGSGADVESDYLGGSLSGSSFRLNFKNGRSFTVVWSLTGRHQAMNAAAAAAVALAIGVTPEMISGGLSAARLPGMRSRQSRFNGATIINDAYNANPESMHASFEWLAEFAEPTDLALLLGGMLELGGDSAMRHAAVLDEAVRYFPHARIAVIGSDYPDRDGVERFDTAAEAANWFISQLTPGRIAFLKGSRGFALENALPPELRQ